MVIFYINKDIKDIIIATSKLNRLGEYNFSQGLVVRNKKVIAIEDSSGTRMMLKKCIRKKYIKTGVLVKFPKKKTGFKN